MGGTRRWSIWLGVLLLAGCNGSAITSVTVSASQMTLHPGETATLSVSVLGTGNFSTAVVWSLDGGGPGLTVSGAGASYTAPTVSAPTSVVVRATSSQDSSKSGTVTLNISVSLGVTVSALVTQLYAGGTAALTATPTAGVPGLLWSIDGGGPGSLSATSGTSIVYTAPPSISAQATVVVRASSSADASVFGTVSLSLLPISVVVSPDATRLYSKQTIHLNGTVNGPASVATGVNWTVVSGGGVVAPASGSDVNYTAPAVSTERAVVLRATAAADPGQHTDVSLTVDHGWPAVVESAAVSAQMPQDFARGVAVDYSTFAVYVAGETSGSFDVPSFGLQDGFVAKLDTYGNLAWVRQFGTPSTETVTGVVADTSGNVYVGGITNGRFPDSTAPPGGDIGFVIAYDKDGTLKWRQDIGPVGQAHDCGVHGLAMDTAQYVYAAGFCVQPLGFVQRCAQAGCSGAHGQLTVVLPSTTPHLPLPYFQAIAVDAVGNYDLVGVTSVSPSVQPTGFVTQVHPNDCPPGLTTCTPAWAAALAPDSTSNGLELVAVATDGNNLYVGGSTDGTVNGGPSLGGKDAVLAVYSKTGSRQWVQQFGTAADDTLTGLAVDVLVSHNALATGTMDQGGGNSDVFLSFYAFNGTPPTAQVTFEPPDNGQPVTSLGGGVAIADGHGNLVLGYTTGAALGGPAGVGLHVGVRKLDSAGNPLSL